MGAADDGVLARSGRNPDYDIIDLGRAETWLWASFRLTPSPSPHGEAETSSERVQEQR